MLNHVGTQIIETKRLILRKFTVNDTEAVFNNWASDEELQKSYGEPVYPTVTDVENLLEKYISGYEKNEYYRWAIILKENNSCIGQIAYFLMDSQNHFGEIEYCIGSEYQCNGYCTEALREVIKYGLENIKLHKVQICHRSNNIPSKRVIEKCGFKLDGTLRDYFYIDGNYYDRLYYSILED